MAEKLGALSSLDRGDFDRLSLGVQGQNRGINLFDVYNFTPSNALTTSVGYATGLGMPMAIGSLIGNYQAEEAMIASSVSLQTLWTILGNQNLSIFNTTSKIKSRS